MKMQVSPRAAHLQLVAQRLKRNWLRNSFALQSGLFFAALSLAFFSRLLFNSTGSVWSKAGNDLTLAFIPWWTFGFREMLHGNFPLWNPHNYCGTPFFSNFNPGMLYPLHLLALLLPLRVAVNLFLVLNVALAGWFTSLWVKNRGVSALGAILAGVIFMFSGAYFHHSYAGHEAPMAGISLTPFIFLCVDKIFFETPLPWILLGMLAVGLQCLAGFPQAVYYTALMSALYVVLRGVVLKDRLRILWRFFLIYLGGAMLAAVQLLPGLQTAGESVRQGGNHFEFATICPLPPENLLQLLAPSVLGDGEHSQYIGAWYPWEVSVFCGVSTLVLAVCGALLGDSRQRRFATTLALISTVLALGVYVKPVYTALYYAMPLFGSFRCVTRFNWFMTLYVACLAGIGFDVLVRLTPWRRWPMLSALAGASALGALAAFCVFSASAGLNGTWGHFAQWLSTRKGQFSPHPGVDGPTAARTALFAASQFGFGALALLCMGGALLSLRWSPRCAYLLAAVTITELVIFANGILTLTPMYPPYPEDWRVATEAADGDSRVLHPTLEYPNTAMVYGFDDVYGYDPVTLKRFADFCAATQNQDPDGSNFVTQIQHLRYHPRLFQLLRCAVVCSTDIETDPDGNNIAIPVTLRIDSPLPRLLLVPRYVIGHSRDQVLKGLRDRGFNPRRTVFLESPPDPAPTSPDRSAAPGSASVVRSSTDWLEIVADLPEPAILLMTDAYSKYWRATAIEPGPQPQYNVMPADYALRAIPLAAGHHRILLAYAPIGYTIGKWISIVSLLVWVYLMIRPRVPSAAKVPVPPIAIADRPRNSIRDPSKRAPRRSGR
jgi:hypothetical protein